MDLIFEVANAAIGAVAYEVAKGGGSPTTPPTPTTVAPCTPQKQRKTVRQGRTRNARTPPTRFTSSRVGESDDDSPQSQVTRGGEEDDDFVDGLDNLDLSLGELEQDECIQSSLFASPRVRGRDPPSCSGYSTAPARRGGKSGPMQMRAGATSVRQCRPPPPPPHSSIKALPTEHVQRFLKLVKEGDYAEALGALRKVWRAIKGRGCSKEAFGGARALLHHLLEGYASAGRLPEALQLLDDMQRGAEARLVSASAFNAVLRGLSARGSLDEVRFLVREEMPRLRVSPTEASFNLLMDTAARAGPAHLEEAWDVLEEMQRRHLRADKYTVSILTKSIRDSGDRRRVPRGVTLVEHFIKSQPEDVDEVLINSLLDVFCRMGDMSRLEATLTKMREYGICGSAVTYGTIVKAYGRVGNIDKVLQAWEAMSKEGLKVNAVTYGCMLDACIKCGHLERALQIFSRMKAQGLHKNPILYGTLIKGFAKSKDSSAARQLHKEMVSEGVQCNVVVFNSLIDACVRGNDLNAAAEVLQQMTAAGVQPDLITFSTLIKGYCSTGELTKAIRLAEELQARDMECDEIVYNSLLEGCVKAGDLQLGLQLFTQMRQRNVRPSSVTFSILVKLLSRAGRLDLASHLVSREMRELHGEAPTRMVWSCLVTCCVKARDIARAIDVLDLLDREGGATGGARASMYATVVEGCLAQGEVGTVLSLCERAYVQARPEEGSRGVLSEDMMRRVFEAVGARGLEAEARSALESIAPRISEQARSSLEEALGRGARRRSPRGSTGGGGSSHAKAAARGSSKLPNVLAESSSLLQPAGSTVADALCVGANSTVASAWSGGCVGAHEWHAEGVFSGCEGMSPADLFPGAAAAWDPTMMAAAAAVAANNNWAWQQQCNTFDMYGYGVEPFFGGPWGSQTWSEAGTPWMQGAFSPASPALSAGGGFAEGLSPSLHSTLAVTRTPDTPGGASACTPGSASAMKTGEWTPATTAGRSPLHMIPSEEHLVERPPLTPLQIRLFPCDAKAVGAGAAAGEVGHDLQGLLASGYGTQRPSEVPRSTPLGGPPGLC